MCAMDPYRGSQPPELACPRCKKRLPPLDVASCACGGVWVTAFAATEVLDPRTLRADVVTRWWRVREPCPECGEQMLLRGEEPGLFQGCDLHGYFIDADTVEHTRLARGIDYAALERKRADERRVDAEREARLQEAQRRAIEKAERERREAELARTPIIPARMSDPEPVAEPVEPPKRMVARRDLEAELAIVLGERVAQLLLDRIRQLEHRVAELEAGLR